MAKDDTIKVREFVFLIVLILGVIALRMFFEGAPLDRDEGAYAYIAAQTIHGGIPYKDTFDHKQPLLYYIYRAAFDLFGVSTEAIRGFTTVYIIFTLLLVYMTARIMGGGFAAMLAALFYALYQHNRFLQGYSSNAEIFTQFPVLLSLLFLLDREKGYENTGFYLSGFFLSVAFFVKAVVAPVMVAPVVYVFFHPDFKKNRPQYFAWYVAGALTVGLLVLGWCLKNGVLKEFIQDNFIYNWNYAASRHSFGPLLRGSFEFTKQNLLAVIALVYAAARMFTKFRDGRNFVLVLTAFALFAGLVYLKGSYPHYYLTLLPVLSLIAAFMVTDLFIFLNGRYGARAAGITLAIVLALNLVVYERATGFFKQTEGEKAMDIFYDASSMGNYINGSKKAGDRLFVLADEPEIYFTSGIRSATRYIYTYPFEFDKAAENTVMNDFTAHPPEFLVVEKSREGKINGQIKAGYNIMTGGKYFNLYRRNGGINEKSK